MNELQMWLLCSVTCRHSRKVQVLSIVLLEALNGLQREAPTRSLCVCQRFCSSLLLLAVLVLLGASIPRHIMKICENYGAESCNVCASPVRKQELILKLH